MLAWAAEVSAGGPQPPAEVAAYYAAFAEEERLATGASRLEFERTKEMLSRLLPPPPARVVDVGGAAGVYSLWLADQGYDVHLVDASERLVEEARRRNANRPRPIASLTVGDARLLPQDDASAAAVLVLGPLYHLTEEPDRLAALREAFRVLAPKGVVAAAAISRYASALAGPGAEAEPRSALRRDSKPGSGRRPAPQHDRSNRVLHDLILSSARGPSRGAGAGRF
jgi:SAM-dependent methyltransferase